MVVVQVRCTNWTVEEVRDRVRVKALVRVKVEDHSQRWIACWRN